MKFFQLFAKICLHFALFLPCKWEKQAQFSFKLHRYYKKQQDFLSCCRYFLLFMLFMVIMFAGHWFVLLELSINGRRLNPAPERGLADGTVCFYHFSFDFRNRLHNSNKKRNNRPVYQTKRLNLFNLFLWG